jgi:hypothetical protein
MFWAVSLLYGYARIRLALAPWIIFIQEVLLFKKKGVLFAIHANRGWINKIARSKVKFCLRLIGQQGLGLYRLLLTLSTG